MILTLENIFATRVTRVSLEHRTKPPPAHALRSDSQRTRVALIEAIGTYVGEHGTTPERLADVAAHSGISLATVYRHFSSVDELVQAHVVQLPKRAAELFAEVGQRAVTDHAERARFHRWNESWVQASVEFGPTAVYLRSPVGFLARRASGDVTVNFVCNQVEPLLEPFAHKTYGIVALLTTWNAVSDPREILDLNATAKWSKKRIARYITDTTLASALAVDH